MKKFYLFIILFCSLLQVIAQDNKLLPSCIRFISEYDPPFIIKFEYDDENRIERLNVEVEQDNYSIEFIVKYLSDNKGYEMTIQREDESATAIYKNISKDHDKIILITQGQNVSADTLFIENRRNKYSMKQENSEFNYFFELDQDGNFKKFRLPNMGYVTSEYYPLFLQAIRHLDFEYDSKNGIFKNLNNESYVLLPSMLIFGYHFTPLFFLHNNVSKLSVTSEALAIAEKIGNIDQMGLNDSDDIYFNYEYNSDNYPEKVYIKDIELVSVEYQNANR